MTNKTINETITKLCYKLTELSIMTKTEPEFVVKRFKEIFKLLGEQD